MYRKGSMNYLVVRNPPEDRDSNGNYLTVYRANGTFSTSEEALEYAIACRGHQRETDKLIRRTMGSEAVRGDTIYVVWSERFLSDALEHGIIVR